ncbi:MAG: hypothetical protein WB699_08500, partial [Bacteroidota bacterium]
AWCLFCLTATQVRDQCDDRTAEAHACPDQVDDVYSANVRHGRATDHGEKADEPKGDQHEKDAKKGTPPVHELPFPVI